LIPFSYQTIDTAETHPAPAPPTSRHLLGTDDRQRDVLARSIYGFRISILFGFTLTIFASIIGIVAGALQGYLGGKVDLFGQRFIEMWSSMPSLYILIILSSILIPNFWVLLFIMVLFSWTSLTGVVRAEFLRTRNFDFVKAARTMGVSNRKIMFRHILPNAMTATMAMLPFIVSGATVKLASLDFLGLGLPPGSPSLGELILQGKNNLEAPWLGLTAFTVMGGMLTMLVFIGEAVRDAFDPRRVL
jgi:microcin C transport system permease protein